MAASDRVILVDLDDQSRDVIESCLSNGGLEIVHLDSELGGAPHHDARLIVFAAEDDLDQVRRLCDSIRNRFGQNAPLLACVGRYVFPTIRPLLQTDIQGLLITPFDADEFRRKLERMGLEF
ncbi:MAG: hypothetical protein ACE5FP_10115 [Gemmatimonadota bacterium]